MLQESNEFMRFAYQLVQLAYEWLIYRNFRLQN